MAFLDEVTLKVKAGKGGNGVVRWRHERAVDMGGPWGGDGGRGGDVFVRGVRNLHTLSNYAQVKEFSAGDGEDGASRNMHGSKGKDITLDFPLGTELLVEEYDRVIDLLVENEPILLFRGGQGGLGNTQFKSSINRSPEESTPGKEGDFGTVKANLKYIADVGLVGYPNAGKSSLLNSLTNAQSKVGNYKFTTLEPHLGDYHGYILADIPGLIEGASEGKGLGTKFLKHIERTNLLVHLIEAGEKDFVKAYKAIHTELSNFNKNLAKKKEIVVVSKIDNLFSDVKNFFKGKLAVTKIVKPKLKKVANKLTLKEIKILTKNFEREIDLKTLSPKNWKKMLKDKISLENKKREDEAKFQKELFKEELQKYSDLLKKQDLEKKKYKEFKDNIKKLEKYTKKKVILLSLYEDKTLKDFEKILSKGLNKRK